MKRTLRTLGSAALVLSWALPVGAQVADHLKCYKVKDPIAKAAYTVNLGGLASENGCVVKLPGKLLCVETVKTVVGVPVPPGAPPGDPAGRVLCYKVKCPKGTPQDVPWTDQFGSRTLQALGSDLLCAPQPATTTTSTTTTTNPPCISGGCTPCGSTCGGRGECYLMGGGGACGTIDSNPVCLDSASCVTSTCTAHNQCGPGQRCVPGRCCDLCP